MNDHVLNHFRSLAEEMTNPNRLPQDWEWQGQWMSQKMFGITERRAKDLEKRYGGVAKKMESGTKISDQAQ
jgi:hypothetical protein